MTEPAHRTNVSSLVPTDLPTKFFPQHLREVGMGSIAHTRQMASQGCQLSGVQCLPVIPELSRLMQEDHEFGIRLGYIIKCFPEENKLVTTKSMAAPLTNIHQCVFCCHYTCHHCEQPQHPLIRANWDSERLNDPQSWSC